ncbi:MAG TPA: type II and III secretion system protein family protein [Alphaproteobacteria bacterium]|nr:type II and III secretion system protein family protein [Alphaproteobacteria bacterium]
MKPLRTWLLITAAVFSFAILRSAPADAAELIPTTGEPVTIEVNEGHLVRIERPASAVFVANPEIAEVAVKSPRLIYVFAKRPGETTLYAVDQKEAVVANLRLLVTHDLSRLSEGLGMMVPQGQVTAQSVNGAIVLTGAVATESEAEDARRLAARFLGENEEVINHLEVTAPNQVNLRVRFAEVSRNMLRQFGINWEALVDAGDFTFGLATGNPIFGPLEQVGSTSTLVQPLLTRQGTPPVNNIFGSYTTDDVDVNTLIDLLAEDDLVAVLAEPNLTALSGETASFLAGGEFPVPVPDDDGIAIEYKKFGVGLAFTPTVLSPNRISMRVNPEVSALSNEGAIRIEGISVPSLTTRTADTTVELASGQSFAIAGLLQNNSSFDHTRVPGLGDMPILGDLFKSDRFNRQETELVIIVTPYVVKPIDDPRAVALPTDAVIGTAGRRAAETSAASASTNQPTAISPAPGLAGSGGFVVVQ